jgi:HPt (histidine-containing phosphotransfer) domain-containing protein
MTIPGGRFAGPFDRAISGCRAMVERLGAGLRASQPAPAGAGLPDFDLQQVSEAAGAARRPEPAPPTDNVAAFPAGASRPIRSGARADDVDDDFPTRTRAGLDARFGRDAAVDLDYAALGELERLGGKPGFATATLAIFAEECAGLIAELEQDMAARRYPQVRDAAHSIKGNASCVGALTMMAASTRIIRADTHLLREDGDKLVGELKRAFERVTLEIELFRTRERERA